MEGKITGMFLLDGEVSTNSDNDEVSKYLESKNKN